MESMNRAPTPERPRRDMVTRVAFFLARLGLPDRFIDAALGIEPAEPTPPIDPAEYWRVPDYPPAGWVLGANGPIAPQTPQMAPQETESVLVGGVIR